MGNKACTDLLPHYAEKILVTVYYRNKGWVHGKTNRPKYAILQLNHGENGCERLIQYLYSYGVAFETRRMKAYEYAPMKYKVAYRLTKSEARNPKLINTLHTISRKWLKRIALLSAGVFVSALVYMIVQQRMKLQQAIDKTVSLQSKIQTIQEKKDDLQKELEKTEQTLQNQQQQFFDQEEQKHNNYIELIRDQLKYEIKQQHKKLHDTIYKYKMQLHDNWVKSHAVLLDPKLEQTRFGINRWQGNTLSKDTRSQLFQRRHRHTCLGLLFNHVMHPHEEQYTNGFVLLPNITLDTFRKTYNKDKICYTHFLYMFKINSDLKKSMFERHIPNEQIFPTDHTKIRYYIVHVNLPGHAILLIFDCKLKKIWRFEPHTFPYRGSWAKHFNDARMLQILKSKPPTWMQKKNQWNTFETIDFHPQMEDDEQKDDTYKLGKNWYCFAWCAWFVDTILSNPSMEIPDLVNDLKAKLLNYKDYRLYITQYSAFILDMTRDFQIKQAEAKN